MTGSPDLFAAVQAAPAPGSVYVPAWEALAAALRRELGAELPAMPGEAAVPALLAWLLTDICGRHLQRHAKLRARGLRLLDGSEPAAGALALQREVLAQVMAHKPTASDFALHALADTAAFVAAVAARNTGGTPDAASWVLCFALASTGDLASKPRQAAAERIAARMRSMGGT
jgi:hypothetical protein